MTIVKKMTLPLLFIAASLIVGCDLQVKSPDNKNNGDNTNSVVTVPKASIYRGLATFTKSGAIATPKKLSEVVNQLVSVGQFSQDDAVKIESQFKGWLNDTRKLTESDSEKLRSLAQ